MKEMIMTMTIASTKVMKSMNPIFLAIFILVVSLMSAMNLYKFTNSSWMAFVMILTFSSGMMTLFMYTASMSANEKMKTNKNFYSMYLIILVMVVMPQTNLSTPHNSMKQFSCLFMIMIMASILITTMVAMSIHGHHPNQTISSSF